MRQLLLVLAALWIPCLDASRGDAGETNESVLVELRANSQAMAVLRTSAGIDEGQGRGKGKGKGTSKGKGQGKLNGEDEGKDKHKDNDKGKRKTETALPVLMGELSELAELGLEGSPTTRVLLEELYEVIVDGDLVRARELAGKAAQARGDLAVAPAAGLVGIQKALAMRDLEKARVLVNNAMKEPSPHAAQVEMRVDGQQAYGQGGSRAPDTDTNLSTTSSPEHVEEQATETSVAVKVRSHIYDQSHAESDGDSDDNGQSHGQDKGDGDVDAASLHPNVDGSENASVASASTSFPECRLSSQSPQVMLQQLEKCASRLREAAGATEAAQARSQTSNEAYRHTLDGVTQLLKKLRDGGSAMAAALQRDNEEARQYFAREVKELYAGVKSLGEQKEKEEETQREEEDEGVEKD